MKTRWHDVTPFSADDVALNDPIKKCIPTRSVPAKIVNGLDSISDVLAFGRLLYEEIREAVAYAKFYSRALIRIYDAAGNMVETHEHAGDFKEW